MAKSRFGGGTLGNGRWDEEEHPRGSDGRFAVAGGGGGTSRAAQARKKLLSNIKRKIENGEPTTDYERELAIKHILPKGERSEFMDDGGYKIGDRVRSGELTGRVIGVTVKPKGKLYKIEFDNGDREVLTHHSLNPLLKEHPRGVVTSSGRVIPKYKIRDRVYWGVRTGTVIGVTAGSEVEKYKYKIEFDDGERETMSYHVLKPLLKRRKRF